MSTCNISFNNIAPPQSAHLYDGILRFVLSAILLILAVAQTLRQSILLYKATKQWHLNQYMQRLTADGILYFIVYAVFSLFSASICYHRVIHSLVLGVTRMKTDSLFLRNVYFSINLIIQNQLTTLSISGTFLLQLFAFITLAPLIPRFIIGVREMYDRDTRGRVRVDTGFGALGQQEDSNTLVSTIAFADGNLGQALVGDVGGLEEIQLEVAGNGTHRV